MAPELDSQVIGVRKRRKLSGIKWAPFCTWKVDISVRKEGGKREREK